MLLRKIHKLSNIDSDGQLHIEEATVAYEIHDDLPIPPFTNEDYAL